MKYFLRTVSIILVLGVIGACCALYYLYQALLPVDPLAPGGGVVFEIVQGESARSIASRLESKGLIRSSEAFRLAVRWTKQGDKLKVGHFRVSSKMSTLEIVQVLVSGKPLVKKITIPEGLTIPQIVRLVEKFGTCDGAEFRRIVTTKGQAYGDFPDNLEGYLLPDTYEIPWVCSASELVGIMTRRFDELARPLVDAQSPLSLRDTVVLASLVEREAQVASERPLIAGVYTNRLDDGMLLQCDATIQFVLGEQKEYLLYSDLKLDSPYNTYLYPGLPPGPICCPGLAAIRAAAHPQKSDFYYYVRNDVKGDGSHVFSRNATEHNNAIRKYQR